jgi:NAD/NADP transhydrogenase beta subunit
MRTRAALLAILVGAAALGCAETTRVERSTRTATAPDGTPVVVQEEKSVQTDVDSCNGILSCTVDFAGTVIAFPFKLVGSLFGAIF